MSEKVYNRARALYFRKIVPINYVEPEMVTLYLSSGESSSALRVAG
jgi:predicted transcriptional regulator